jgi:hypothetical protein
MRELALLDTIALTVGAHDNPDDGLCLMEAVAFMRGLEHTDSPACVSPVLAQLGRNLNDALPDALRQDLKPLIPLLPGTAGDGHDEARGYLALDWLIRVYTPTWLQLAGLSDEANALRELGRIVDLVSAERAGPVVKAVRDKADAAWAAARAAAWDAAWDAARDAARAAAGAAAGAAAWAAAWDAAWDAAGAAAGAAAWAAAGAAAWAAAGAALAPTVEVLQRSAIGLFTTMISPT